MKDKVKIALMAAALISAMSGTTFGATSMIIEDYGQLGDGNWEYIYSVEGVGSDWVINCSLEGYDFSKLLNQCDPPHYWGSGSGTMNQKWDDAAANNPATWNYNCYGSVSTDGSTWTMTGQDHDILNAWRDPWEYTGSYNKHGWNYAGVIVDADPADGEGTLTFNTHTYSNGTGVILTFRIVAPDAPASVNYVVGSYIGAHQSAGSIIGPGSAGVQGDFSGNGTVDAEDIDMLTTEIEAGTHDPDYDLTGDGFVTEADLIKHVAEMVETGLGVGTYRGDFNLDGYVDGTDLAILKAGFGLTGLGYALGNANADNFVDGTDLAIFKATFGFSGTPGEGGNPPAVPEPATLGLLGLGAVALLRRRK